MRTPIFAALRREVRALCEAESAQPESAQPGRIEPGITRRHMVGGSLAIGAASAFGGLLNDRTDRDRTDRDPTDRAEAAAPVNQAASPPRIVIIGAGLAGLTAAYRLKQAGHRAEVFEATARLGGRCRSLRSWRDDQVSERGGELIDTGHVEIIGLADELGLSLESRPRATPHGTESFYFFDGLHWPREEVRRELRSILTQAQNDAKAAGFPILYNSFTPRARELDLMSIRDWIEAYVPGGVSSRLGQLVDVAYTIEYGAEIDRQSSLNLINLFGYAKVGDPNIFGESDEVFHVAGGNDQIVSRMAEALPGQVSTRSVLTALSRLDDGRYSVRIGDAATIVADYVLLALPFTLLREVDLTRAGFPALKTHAINHLPMGQNTKLVLQFHRRRWYDAGCDGESFSDSGYQATWETTLGQAGAPGLITNFTGGNVALDFTGASPNQFARRFLDQLAPVLPDVPAAWNGQVSLEFWPGNPWTHGSYSYYAVGDYTSFAGVEREAVGRCHFAGEHTSINSQGYLNGAVETGERAAREILDAIASAAQDIQDARVPAPA